MQSESPISVPPLLCLETPCFLYAHSSMLPPLPPAASEQLTGKYFLIMLVMLNYWDFWSTQTSPSSSECWSARARTHTQIPLGGISQRDGGSPLIGLLQYILSFSKSGLEGQGAVGMSMIAAGKDCPDPQPPGKSGWSCAPSLCPSSVVLHSLVPQADVPIVVVKGFYLPKKKMTRTSN